MNLDLKTVLPPNEPLEVYDRGELEESDLSLVGTAKAPTTELRRLSDRHHMLAKGIALGMTNAELCARFGYSASRISVLKADKAFQMLIEHYREIGPDAAFRDLQETMSSLAVDALDELHRRIEDEPEKIAASLLLNIAEKMADRTGHAPVSKSISHHVHENLADRLAAARKRVSNMKDITPKESEDGN